MSQRNWKTTQRKTNRNVLQNFASRPISSLSSIKEGSINSGTTGHSAQSSTGSSEENARKEANQAIEQQTSDDAVLSTSTPNNDIYQIIEEECNNGEMIGLQTQSKQVFQSNGGLEKDDNQFVDLDTAINSGNIEEKGGDYDEDDDDSNPIIYAHHDDDSISQITSSVAGYSMYSSDHALTKQLDGQNKKTPTMNHGGVSHMRPNMFYGNSFGSQNSMKKRHGNSTEEDSPLMEDEELNKFFGPSDGGKDRTQDEEKGDDLIDVDIYTNNNVNRSSSESQYQYNGKSDAGDDLTLRDMYSIGASISKDSRRTFTTEAQNEISFASILQKARLKSQAIYFKAKYLIDKYIQLDASNTEQKKNDDLDQGNTDGGETDYFGILMSSSFVSSSPNSSLYRFRNRKENHINFIWISCLLILIWLLLYLAKIGNDAAWEKRQMQRFKSASSFRVAEPSPVNEVDNINVAEIEVFHPDKTLPQYSETAKLEPISQPEVIVPEETPANSAKNVPVTPAKEVPVANIDPVQVDTSHIGMPLPEYFNNFLDVTDNTPPQIPFFWHIPRTAGATINEILSTCYHLRLASNAGGQGHDQDKALKLLDVGAGHSYVNVDVSSSQGIQHAISMGLVPSGLSDVVITALINEAGPLFDPSHKARTFTMIRHPVMRAASLFYFLQDARWKNKNTYNEELANISIHEFFKRRLGESNWQVRYLTNQVTKPYIDESDLKLAKEILRRKCFIGLTSEREESFARFQKLFGWQLKDKADSECLNNKLQWDWALKHTHEAVEEGSEVWNLISEHNQYDVELFEYAKVLFKEQGALLK